MIDRSKGFTSVFTLNLSPISFNYYGSTSMYQSYERNQWIYYRDNYSLSPGILVKYFNGIEHKIPLKDQFIEISRFIQSKDGRFFTIFGTKYEQVPDSLTKNRMVDQFTQGIFIYEFKLTEIILIDTIKFPERSIVNCPEIQKKIDSLPRYSITKKLNDNEKEIQTLEVGEYESDEFLTYLQSVNDRYESELKLKETDEFYLLSEWEKKYNKMQ